VLIALARPGGTGAGASIATVLAELAAGVALGVLVPFAVSRVLRLPALGIEPRLQPLGPVAVAVGLYALCHYTHANSYLAAFFAGATIASLSPSTAEAFEPLGEQVSELLKFAAVLVFGGLLTPHLLARVPAGGRPAWRCPSFARGCPAGSCWRQRGSGPRASPASCTDCWSCSPASRRRGRSSPWWR